MKESNQDSTIYRYYDDNLIHFRKQNLVKVAILSILTAGLYSVYWSCTITKHKFHGWFEYRGVLKVLSAIIFIISIPIIFLLHSIFMNNGFEDPWLSSLIIIPFFLQAIYLEMTFDIEKVIKKPIFSISLSLFIFFPFGISTVIAQSYINEYENELEQKIKKYKKELANTKDKRQQSILEYAKQARRRKSLLNFSTLDEDNSEMDSNCKISKGDLPLENLQLQLKQDNLDNAKEYENLVKSKQNRFLETKIKYIVEAEKVISEIDKTGYNAEDLNKLLEKKNKFNLDIANVEFNSNCLDELKAIRENFLKDFNYEENVTEESNYLPFIKASLLRLEKIYKSIDSFSEDTDKSYLKARQAIKKVPENDQYESIINRIIDEFESKIKNSI